MASLISVRLDKGSSPSLGFRLQGGTDFGTPLVIQKVNGGSPAERAGLIAGDSVIKINNTEVFNLRHKDAQDVIVRAGPAFEVTIQRGGSTWKPSVIPTGPLQSSPTGPVTKTSLAATSQTNFDAIGTGHNLAAKPFNPQVNGSANGGPPQLVNNQYNSPLKLYSDQSIAETLSAQTEVLSTGALGVNFKKNEKNYDATNSAVYRMLQEAEKEPRSPESVSPRSEFYATQSHAIGGGRPPPNDHSRLSSRLGTSPEIPPQEGSTKCTDCNSVIVGVFVRIKDKNLHVECFKCSTCGSSLKNVGYYNINNKLYCDVHAKLAALNNPPTPNLVPVTAPPGGRAPAGAISAALSSHSLPSPAPLSPRTSALPSFQPPPDDKGADLSTPLQNLNITPESNSHKISNNLLNNSTPLSFDKFLNKAGNYSTTPKPFSSVSALSPNYNSLPRAAPVAPLSPVVAPAPAPSALSFSPASSAGRSAYNIVWPPPPEEPDLPTACPIYVPPKTHLRVVPKPYKLEKIDNEEYSEVEEIMAQYLDTQSSSICSAQVCELTGRRSAAECVKTISRTLERQGLVDTVLKNTPQSPPSLDKDIVVSSECCKKTVCSETSSARSTETKSICSSSSELKRLSEFKPNTVECTLKSHIENAVPQQWESSMVQALRTIPDHFTQIPQKSSSSALASALVIAPAEPFSSQPSTHLKAVPLPEETVPYFPPEHEIVIEPKEPKPEKPESQFVKALQTVPDRPFTPVGAPVKKKKDPTDVYFQDLPKPQERLRMRDALATASERPYTPLVFENVSIEQSCVKECKVERQDLQRPLKPATLPTSFQQPKVINAVAPKPFPVRIEETRAEKSEDSERSKTIEKHHSETVESVVPVEEQQHYQLPLFKGFSCSFENKSEHSQFSVEISTTPPIPNARAQTPNVKVTRTEESSESVREQDQVHKSSQETKKEIIEKQAEEIVLKKPLALASALHKPQALPQYQVNLSESVEADLQLMEKINAAKSRHELQKVEVQKQPIIVVHSGEAKPVSEDRPQSVTFSPRPRPVTPSMINKPPPTLPYYQSSLVAQQCRPPQVNLLDPHSPAISRSPSPCPDRSASPFPAAGVSSLRPKSPAQGPPPNLLQSHQPLPTKHDFEVETARKNLTSYIPQHKNKVELAEQMYVARTETRNFAEEQNLQLASIQGQCVMTGNRQIEDSLKNQVICKESQEGSVRTAISEQAHLDHLEQSTKSKSVEVSQDGRVQVQRKKVVTEEFEHSQKSKTIQIEKNSCPFRDVKNPKIEEHGIVGLHVTNPHPIISKFIQADSAGQLSIPPPNQTLPLPPPPPPPQPQIKQTPPVKHVPAPSASCPIKHVTAPSACSRQPNQNVNKSSIPVPNTGAGGGRQTAAVGVAPRRGRGVLNAASLGGARVPLCGSCHSQIRGPFITALGKIWCPDHFVCATPSCRRPLQDLGFVEEQGQLYCEYCFEQYLAPPCSKCNIKIKGDCLKAIGKNFHPECFNCVYCGKLFSNAPFFLEDGSPYCEADWNELFTTKCYACGFPVEAGDRWVEALNNNYHSQCFNCTMCKKNLEGQSFFAKGGRPFCKNHAR